jgi:hypothetical protein
MSHERLTGDINSDVQGFHVELPFLQGWENPRVSEGPGTWRPRSLAKESAVTPPFVDDLKDGVLPAEERSFKTTGCAAACVVSIQVLQAGPADFRKRSTARKEKQRSPLLPQSQRSQQECSGILQEHSTGTSEISRNIGRINFGGGSGRQRLTDDFLTATAYC